MVSITANGSTIHFIISKKPLLWDGSSVGVTIAVQNETVTYTSAPTRCDFEDLENLLYNIYRLIAGGHRKRKQTRVEGIDGWFIFDPIVDGDYGYPSREFLRAQPFKMDMRLVLSSKREQFGEFAFSVDKEQLKVFAYQLNEELSPYLRALSKCHGKYMFVGVSPQGYKGCNYWYFDPEKKTQPNTFVWVKMGRNETLQLVYVDSVRRFNEYSAPCSIDTKKRVLKQANEEDIAQAKQIWKE